MTTPSKTAWWPGFYGKHSGKIWLGQAFVLLIIGFAVASNMTGGPSQTMLEDSDGPSAASSDGPQLWTCSMHPQIRSPKPGACPICGMDLIPVAKTSGGMRTLTVSPEAAALMSIATSPVERRYVMHSIPMVGKVDYDESKLGYITAWVSGRLDRLFVDFTGVKVEKNDHMVYIYSEELYAAQEELIQALKHARQRPASKNRLGIGDIDLVESSREKLRLVGLTEVQIKELEARNAPSDHLTIYSPVAGIVVEKLRQEGERVKLGDRIYTIADLSQVWVNLDAYESDLPWIRYGQDVVITTEANPGEELHGRIAFIQPILNDKTRTVEVRVNVPNLDGKLKPGMFVHATVHPRVASGGRVMDSALSGKWISPMHPEIIKDEPGKCDICGMPLVRAESLGYVAADTDQLEPPLVIPRLAAMVTGTRAVVYVQLPSMHSAAEPAFQTLSAIVEDGKREKIRAAFSTYARMLDKPYDQPGTNYAKQLWDKYASRFGKEALAGQRASTAKEFEQVLARIEDTMNEAREQFAPEGQPTFEGREILLGARAGKHYLVRRGLEEGELVVTQGNFKIDSEIQIQAKPSMMTPEGSELAGNKTVLAAEFYDQIRDLEARYEEVATAVEQGNLPEMAEPFGQFQQALLAVDISLLTPDLRLRWKELSMLLGNDALEGRDVTRLTEADRVFLLLKGHMRRMRHQLGVSQVPERTVEHVHVEPEFQAELEKLWVAYLSVQRALASDDFAGAQQALTQLHSSLAAIDPTSVTGKAQQVWTKERENLTKILGSIQDVEDIKALRVEFKPLSEEIGVIAKAFGFGAQVPVYELHCPMFSQGATWYQDDDQVRNPYYGASMLGCSDRVEKVENRQAPDSSLQPPEPPPDPPLIP